jgi:NADH-quinone oxidoreductase subunit M
MLVAAVLASIGMVLGATYMLRFARAVLFGGDSGATTPVRDLRLTQIAPVVPLLLVVLWIGVAPAPLMKKVQAVASGVAELSRAHATPKERRQAALTTQDGDRAR